MNHQEVFLISEKKINIKDYSPQKLINAMIEMNEPSYRADQLLNWIYKKKVSGFHEMTNLPASLLNKLDRIFDVDTLSLKKKIVSPQDGTVKYLFSTGDSQFIEGVFMRQNYGNTVCVSSQVGCKHGCVFCASALGGMVRNLSAGEMLDQFILAERNLDGQGKIKNIVVMGMGEPLDNYNNLVKFLKTANNPRGLDIGFRNITVSTAGIPSKIIELGKENLPITLALSLHAPDNESRSKIMPISKKYSISQVMDSCEKYFRMTGRRITIEYILISGVNDTKEKARELTGLLKNSDFTSHVNLIPVNNAGRKDIKSPPFQTVRNFYDIVKKGGISVSIRKERGVDIEGACGQLRRRITEDG